MGLSFYSIWFYFCFLLLHFLFKQARLANKRVKSVCAKDHTLNSSGSPLIPSLKDEATELLSLTLMSNKNLGPA
jgi:hypothetical protein